MGILNAFHLGKNKETIAIDIGSYSIKVLQIRKSHKSYSLVKFGSILLQNIGPDLSPAEKKNAIISRLAEFLASEKISVKNAATSVSGDSVVVRNVRFNKMPADLLKKTIASEAQTYVPFDIKEADFSFHILSGDGDPEKMDVMLVIAKKEVISSRLEILNALKLKTAVIDIDAFAAANAYELNFGSARNETVLLANIGESSTRISILSNHVIRLVSDISVAGNTFTNALIRALNCDHKTAEDLKHSNSIPLSARDKETVASDEQKLKIANALAQTAGELLSEIQKSMESYVHQKLGNRIDRILLCGGGANLGGLDKYLHQQLKIPAALFNPFGAISRAKDISVHMTSEFGVAVGLAMRQGRDL